MCVDGAFLSVSVKDISFLPTGYYLWLTSKRLTGTKRVLVLMLRRWVHWCHRLHYPLRRIGLYSVVGGKKVSGGGEGVDAARPHFLWPTLWCSVCFLVAFIHRMGFRRSSGFVVPVIH